MNTGEQIGMGIALVGLGISILGATIGLISAISKFWIK